MTRVEFEAHEYRADTSFRSARYRFEGSPEQGWRIVRDGEPHLELGPGYRLLRTAECGVCSTDLARHFLPFPLPQVTGHELVAHDADGRRYVVEINASHRARGVGAAESCPFCAGGLPTHCPERLVLGIHDLPGGFGPWVLVPVEAAIEVPEAVPTSAAVLVEPFAAALHAVTTLFGEDASRADVERIAVLGPRRLGMLVVAALAGWRARHGATFEILALARRAPLLDLARRLGATEGRLTPDAAGGASDLPDGLADVVVDTTGSPDGLALATRLARREVHLKSTHGRPAAGLAHTTELVVDELAVAPLRAGESLARLARDGRPRVAWLVAEAPPAELEPAVELVRAVDAGAALAAVEATPPPALPRCDAAVVGDAAGVDAAIRPREGSEVSLVRPRGEVLVHPGADASGSPLLAAVLERGLCLSSSRCGDFRRALALIAEDERLRRLGDELVTHRFGSADLPRAFDVARTAECLKAVVSFPAEASP